MIKKNSLYSLLLAALFLAVALILPLLTGQLRSLGNALCPMHLPVLLCGFICGERYGFTVGLLAPLLRFAFFGMPPLMPRGIAMCAELAVYGLTAGLLYGLLPKKKSCIYVSLLGAMLAGRIVWGITRALLVGVGNSQFGFAAFITGGFVDAVPGIVLQVAVIPLIVMAAEKTLKK